MLCHDFKTKILNFWKSFHATMDCTPFWWFLFTEEKNINFIASQCNLNTEFDEMCYQIKCICFQTAFKNMNPSREFHTKDRNMLWVCVCVRVWIVPQSFEFWNLTVYHNKWWFKFQFSHNNSGNLILTFISMDAFATDGQWQNVCK